MTPIRIGALLAVCLALLCVVPAQAQQANMSFFVTSVGPGQGANLGGLAGADKHCQQLAQAAGADAKTWHAYLSTQGEGAVNAHDRIGKGPWQNAKGVVIATSVDDLHSANNCRKRARLSTAAATSPIGTTFSLAPARTAPLSHRARTALARTTRAARRAPSCLVIMIARA